MSKCECCDQRGLDGVYHNEGFYCLMCYYETYHLLDFEQGYFMACADIKAGDIEPQSAVMSFEYDPPDCARHYGYLKACEEYLDNAY